MAIEVRKIARDKLDSLPYGAALTLHRSEDLVRAGALAALEELRGVLKDEWDLHARNIIDSRLAALREETP